MFATVYLNPWGSRFSTHLFHPLILTAVGIHAVLTVFLSLPFVIFSIIPSLLHHLNVSAVFFANDWASCSWESSKSTYVAGTPKPAKMDDLAAVCDDETIYLLLTFVPLLPGYLWYQDMSSEVCQVHRQLWNVVRERSPQNRDTFELYHAPGRRYSRTCILVRRGLPRVHVSNFSIEPTPVSPPLYNHTSDRGVCPLKLRLWKWHSSDDCIDPIGKTAI